MPDDVKDAVAAATAELNAATGDNATDDTTPATSEPAKADPAPKSDPAPKDDKPAPAPKAEAKVAAKIEAAASEEEVFTPTAEELALIDKSPELKKVYRSMQRGLTQKTTALANTRKDLEEQAKIVNWIQQDPENALRSLAQAAGVKLGDEVVPAKATTEEKIADSLEAKWAKTVGTEAAALLRPLFEETAQALLEERLGPLEQDAERARRDANASAAQSDIRGFGASVVEAGEEWNDEIQGEMAKLASVVDPAEEATLPEYLATLYDSVIAKRNRARVARANLERLRKARTEDEPNTSARPSPATEEKVTIEMSDNDAIALAVRQARQHFASR